MKNLKAKVITLVIVFCILSLAVMGWVFYRSYLTRKEVMSSSSTHQEEMVKFNTHSLRYHKPSCEWAKKCTRNCIYIPLSEAKKRGGRPCPVCGG